MKKNKKFIFLLLFFFNLSISCQEVFEAKYSINFKSINYDSILKNNKKLNNYNNDFYRDLLLKEEQKLKNISKKTNLSLIFDKDESVFLMEEMLAVNKINGLKIFRIRIGLYGSYYNDRKTTLESKNSYGQDFIVSIPKFKWNITSITKKIGQYNCFKATTFKKIENSKGKQEMLVEAWFAPELPYNFGPKEFNGLPGLIIELKEGNNLTFRLIKLIKIKNRKIKKPTKGKKITLEEFKALSKKMYENRKK